MTKYLWILLIQTLSLYAPETSHSSGMIKESLLRKNYLKLMEKSDFTPERFYNTLVFQCKEPGILFQQAILETGWFTSESFLKYNNPFGMKVPHIRDTFVRGEGLKHGAYDHWTDAVKDMALWQDYWYSKGWNMNDYYNFLELLGYAEDPLYVKKLQTLPTKPIKPKNYDGV